MTTILIIIINKWSSEPLLVLSDNRVPTCVDLINLPQNQVIQVKYTKIPFSQLYTRFIVSYLSENCQYIKSVFACFSMHIFSSP